MAASDSISPSQFGLTVEEGYFPEKHDEYKPSGYETVDPTSLIATQGELDRQPSLGKITSTGRRLPPSVYEHPETGSRYIGDGHHRISAHAKAGKPIRVRVWKRGEGGEDG